MSVNILDLFRNQVEGTLISAASGFLGESELSTKKGLDSISSTLMGAMVQKSSNETGANNVLDLVSQGGYGAAALDELDVLNSNDAHKLNEIMNKGLPMARTLLGDKIGAVTDWISTNNGLKSSSVASLMSLAAPFLVGIVGRAVSAGNLGTTGLRGLLAEQVPYVKTLLPAGLAGINNFTAINNPTYIKETPIQTTYQTTPPVRPDPINNDNSSLGRFLPWLILIIGLGMLWYFARGCNNTKVENTMNNADAAMDSTTANVADAVDTIKLNASNTIVALKGKVDEFGNWVSDLGNDYEVKLPNGVVLKVYESSVERNLVDFINSGEKDEEVLKNKWFSFDRLYFKSAKSELTDASKGQLDNIAAILKAYPGVNIKMGGYTDSDGAEDFNQKLSAERAETAKKELLKRGIGSGRVESEGYGEQYPRCAANDTKECKSQNRRIDIRITKM